MKTYRTVQQFLDELQIFCPEALPKARASVFGTDVAQALVDCSAVCGFLLAKLRETDMALQSLTPGGSEYVNDCDRCVNYVKNVRESLRGQLRTLPVQQWLRMDDCSFHDPCGTIWRQRDGSLYAVLDHRREIHCKLPQELPK